MNFKIVLEKDEDGGYTVTVPSLPGCISQGDTKEEAMENIKEAINEIKIALLEADILVAQKTTKAAVGRTFFNLWIPLSQDIKKHPPSSNKCTR